MIILLGGLILARIQANKIFSPPYLFVVLSLSSVFTLGILTSTKSKAKEIKSHFSNYKTEGANLQIKVLKPLFENEFNRSFIGRIEFVDSVSTEGIVMLKIPKEDSTMLIDIDDILVTSERLTKIKSPDNPGEFSFKEYVNHKGIYFKITLDKNQFIKLKKAKKTLRSRALILRKHIIESIKKRDFSKKQLMVIEALLLGERKDLSKELKDDYKNAGAMHILAISGLHIGVLMMLLNGILSPITRMRQGKYIRVFILVLSLWSFAFISGLSASVIRAVTMFSILSVGIILKRKTKLDHYLFIAIFISLLFHPLYVFDVGFQLSYTAVISILYAGPKIKRLWIVKNKVLSYFWELIAISIAAQLGVLPLSLYYFHHFSAVFLLSSIIIIPFLGVLLGGGYLLVVLVQFNFLPRIYVRVYGFLIELMNKIVGYIGEMELFIFQDIYFNVVLLLLAYSTVYFMLRLICLLRFSRLIVVILCLFIISTYLLVQHKVYQSTSNFIVFNNYRTSLLAFRKGHQLMIYSSSKEETPQIEFCLVNYSKGFIGLKKTMLMDIRHFYEFQNKRVMVIDDEVIDTDFGFDPDVLVLIGSPKLNLERLLERVSPSLIVADGSNYSSVKALWKKTCANSGIAFHNTSVDGALILPNLN